MLTFDKASGMYRLDLEGGLFGTDDTWAMGQTFGDAVETALDIFRRTWTDQIGPKAASDTQDRPRPPEGPPLEYVSESGKVRPQETRFRCVGDCWTSDCECRQHEGDWNPPMLPPLHKGCHCVVEPAQRPTSP